MLRFVLHFAPRRATRVVIKARRSVKDGPNNFRGLDRRMRAHWLRRPQATETEREIARGRAAIERVLETNSDVLDAMYRPDLGSVSFIWGRPGRFNASKQRFVQGEGIAKIIAQRDFEGDDGVAVARSMPEVIGKGDVVEVVGAGTLGARVVLSYRGKRAVLSLFRLDERRTWLLTGWTEWGKSGR